MTANRYLAALLLTLAVGISCRKSPDQVPGQTLDFATEVNPAVEGLVQSRAGIGTPTTSSNLKDKAFGVYGLYAVSENGEGTNVFDLKSPTEVRYAYDIVSKITRWTYTFSGSYYNAKKMWQRNMYYRFRAYHPYEADVLQSASDADNLNIEYRVREDSYDLLVASKRRYPASEGYNEVPMEFKHALCALRFKVGFNSDVTPVTYTDNLKSFCLMGLNAAGLMSYTGYQGDATVPEELSWSGIYNNVDELYSWTGNKEFGVKGRVEPVSVFDTNMLFAIPQTCSGADGPTSVHFFTDNGGVNDHTVDLPTLKWEPGKIYTYTLLISKSDITASVDIEPWTVKQIPIDIYL